jgi:hypothetical protein
MDSGQLVSYPDKATALEMDLDIELKKMVIKSDRASKTRVRA